MPFLQQGKPLDVPRTVHQALELYHQGQIAEAERLYARTGWTRVGSVPGFALLPQGEPCATTFFYLELARV